MNQFVFQQGSSRELQSFPHILELGVRKNSSIQLDSLPETATEGIRIYYVLEGKFDWRLHEKEYLLYPGDLAFILPHQQFGSPKGFLEIGSLSWLHFSVQKLEEKKMLLGKWSSLSETESLAIARLLWMNNSSVLSRLNEGGRILQIIHQEIKNREIGFYARVNQLIDELLILVCRQLSQSGNSGRDFPKMFMILEQELRQNLSNQWTVEEMAALVGMGTTLFNEKVKNYSGFSPINYLINIRISEAIKLLKKPEISVTDIALDTGFYSSQHFSTTFKKLTGFTPSEFRKKNSSRI